MKATVCRIVSMAIWMIFLGACMAREPRHGGMTLREAFSEGNVRALAQAAADGECETIRESLAGGVDANASGRDGVTALWWAIMAKSYTGFECLLDRGADPNVRPAGHMTVMELAALVDDERYLQAVVARGGDVNLESDRRIGNTPIFAALSAGNRKALRKLIELGANLDYEDPFGGTPLIAAAMINDFESVFFLLQSGANPRLVTKTGATLERTMASGRIDPSSDNYRWRERVVALLSEDAKRDK